MDKKEKQSQDIMKGTISSKEEGFNEPVLTTEKVEVNKDALDKLLARVEKQDEKLKMLEAVADKGRVFNYESRRATKKPMKVHLCKYNDKYIIGWRNALDVIKYHPTTGMPVGEEQQMELILLDKEGKTTKEMIHGYARFVEIGNTNKVECDVISKNESWDGKWTYNIKLPDGREISLDQAFINL